MKNKTLVWVGVYVVVGYFAYSYLYSKKMSIKRIVSAGNFEGNPSTLNDFDSGFLRMWGNASKNNLPAFIYKGKVYNSKGGRAKL